MLGALGQLEHRLAVRSLKGHNREQCGAQEVFAPLVGELHREGTDFPPPRVPAHFSPERLSQELVTLRQLKQTASSDPLRLAGRQL
jgi:hypothetical protein